ncbi:hypothetical protein ACERK3_09445 [Phycisphaerales bacterium AB-hyl4]|uniref:Small CPxCG-related zinc finger protein n=1 Tax=Natronomicrosphaera hydrolytica TaxID=3242702 RepID=A0ABV4U4I9_9BACT
MAKRKRNQATASPQPPRPTSSAAITQVPASCPHCQATDLTELRVVADRALVGRTPAGDRYDRVTWSDQRCTGCGASVRVRTYHHAEAH